MGHSFFTHDHTDPREGGYLVSKAGAARNASRRVTVTVITEAGWHDIEESRLIPEQDRITLLTFRANGNKMTLAQLGAILKREMKFYGDLSEINTRLYRRGLSYRVRQPPFSWNHECEPSVPYSVVVVSNVKGRSARAPARGMPEASSDRVMLLAAHGLLIRCRLGGVRFSADDVLFIDVDLRKHLGTPSGGKLL